MMTVQEQTQVKVLHRHKVVLEHFDYLSRHQASAFVEVYVILHAVVDYGRIDGH